jgi:hypothetical protein
VEFETYDSRENEEDEDNCDDNEEDKDEDEDKADEDDVQVLEDMFVQGGDMVSICDENKNHYTIYTRMDQKWK